MTTKDELKAAYLAGFEASESRSFVFSGDEHAMFDSWYEGRQKAKLALKVEDVHARMAAEKAALDPVAKPESGCCSLQFADDSEPVIFDECSATGRSCEYEFDKVLQMWQCKYCGKAALPGQCVEVESRGPKGLHGILGFYDLPPGITPAMAYAKHLETCNQCRYHDGLELLPDGMPKEEIEARLRALGWPVKGEET